jgi:hypothetical protein
MQNPNENQRFKTLNLYEILTIGCRNQNFKL